MIPD